jgi:hypothetical protein
MQSMVLISTVRSGCLSYSGGGGSPDGPRRVVSADTTVPGDQVEISAEVWNPDITIEHTASLKITITWKGEQPKQFQFGNRVPFSYPKYSSTPNDIVLMPPQNRTTPQEERRWVPSTYNGEIISQANVVGKKLANSESVAAQWSVWANPKNEKYILPGDYTFKDRIRISELDDNEYIDIDWGLNLKIISFDS